MMTPEQLAELKAEARDGVSTVAAHYCNTAAALWAIFEDLFDEIEQLQRGGSMVPPEAFTLDEAGRPLDGRPDRH
jgi:hypothetical protein